MYIFKFIFLILFISSYSQETVLTNPTLKKYYKNINRAELAIVDGQSKEANKYYRNAFKVFSEPHAKDLYNHMMVLIKLKKYRKAYKHYHQLKCLKYPFDDDFFNKHFNRNFKAIKNKCLISIDTEFKNNIDSLLFLDQYYRILSEGQYEVYIDEMKLTDSLVSNKFYKLIHEKGFPNEYDIGLYDDKYFNQGFYYIIFHQLKTNRFYGQQVDFTDYLYKAINNGKIIPETAANLIDLNSGKDNFYSKHFEILRISYRDEDFECCYVHEWFFPENRDDSAKQMISKLDKNRTAIGLSTIDDLIKKRRFHLRNNDYIFPKTSYSNSQYIDSTTYNMIKTHLIKINDTDY